MLLHPFKVAATPDLVGIPVGFRDEVLQRLITARVAQPRPHRFHRLATAVAQHAFDVALQAASLGAMIEGRLERLEDDRRY